MAAAARLVWMLVAEVVVPEQTPAVAVEGQAEPVLTTGEAAVRGRRATEVVAADGTA